MSDPPVDAILYWIEPYEDLKYDHEKCVVSCACCRVDLTGVKLAFIFKHVNSILHQTKSQQSSPFIQSWIEPYPELRYDADRSAILCTLCDVTITQLKKDNVVKHIKSARHQKRTGVGACDDTPRLEEMRRKRIKAAKKAKLAKIKQLQAQVKNDNQDRLQETEDIDTSIKEGLKQVNKRLMKKDDRFKDVIGKISKIKRKAEKASQDKSSTKKDKSKKKKKKGVTV